MRICEAVTVCASHKLQHKKGTFELLGMDFMVDDSGNPFLIEANTNPALFTDTHVQKEVITPMMHQAMQIVFASHSNITHHSAHIVDELRLNHTWNDWVLLYDKFTSYSFV